MKTFPTDYCTTRKQRHPAGSDTPSWLTNVCTTIECRLVDMLTLEQTALTCTVCMVARSSPELVCMHGMMTNCQSDDSTLSVSETQATLLSTLSHLPLVVHSNCLYLVSFLKALSIVLKLCVECRCNTNITLHCLYYIRSTN